VSPRHPISASPRLPLAPSPPRPVSPSPRPLRPFHSELVNLKSAIDRILI
jgi:hypothetical protein